MDIVILAQYVKVTRMPKLLRCVCGHALNKHHTPKSVQTIYHKHDSSRCNVKGCDCDLWRWNKKQPGDS